MCQLLFLQGAEAFLQHLLHLEEGYGAGFRVVLCAECFADVLIVLYKPIPERESTSDTQKAGKPESSLNHMLGEHSHERI
jgi:hypothetical protein